MSTSHSLGRERRGLAAFEDEDSQTRYLKTSYCFEHTREQSGQACPRLVSMIAPGHKTTARMPSPQTRDHPGMFPLHDVLEPAKVTRRLLALRHVSCETFS